MKLTTNIGVNHMETNLNLYIRSVKLIGKMNQIESKINQQKLKKCNVNLGEYCDLESLYKNSNYDELYSKFDNLY